jgi:tetratricopeptide (TPR) repeat protein
MAPEQYVGASVDARTDQFSFCVTLFEALAGERPFTGRTFEELMDATLAGRTSPAPRLAALPAWLRRVVLQGLEIDPARRHATMDALLRALADDPAIRRRRLFALAGGVALLALAGTGVARFSTRNQQLCRGADRKLAGIWDDGVRGRVRATFERLGVGRASTASVTAVLDQYARGFVEQHVDACEATRLRGEQPEQVLAVRMSCLDGRLKELGALTSLLAAAERETAQRSVEAASQLSSLAACADVAALTARVPPPTDPGVRREVERLHGCIAEARALENVARFPEALAVIDEVLKAAPPGYDPLRAEALELRGVLLDQTGKSQEADTTLADAIDVGYSGHDDALVARAAISLAEVYGNSLARRTEGHRWARLGQAAVARMGGSDELEADRLRVEASLFLFEGKGKDAVAAAERALALSEKVHGKESLNAAHVHGVLGSALRVSGDYARARVEHQENLRLFEKLLGPEHPRLMVPLNNLGIVADSEDKEEEAAKYYRAAVELAERALGPDHPKLAVALSNYSSALRGLKRHEEALVAGRRALAIYDAKYGPDYPDSEGPLLGIGQSLTALRRPDEAVTALERALALVTRGESAPSDVGEVKSALADALWNAGRDRTHARRLQQQALEIFRSLGPVGKDDLALAETWLASH